MPLSRYGGVTGSKHISEDFENINVAFNNVATESDTNKSVVTNHIADNIRHITKAEHDKLTAVSVNSYTKVNGMEASTPSDELLIVGDVGIDVTQNPIDKSIHLTVTGTSTPGKHAATHLTSGSDPIPVATSTTSGLMSPEDKQAVVNATTQLADIAAKTEKGVWTPSITSASGSANMSSNSYGSYIRQGDFVYLQFYAETTSKGGLAGTVEVGGFPFTPYGGSLNDQPTIYIGLSEGVIFVANSVLVFGQVGRNSNKSQLRFQKNDGTVSNVAATSLADIVKIRGFLTYKIA